MKIPLPPDATRFFTKLGIAFLVVGGLLAMFLSRDRINPDYEMYQRLTVAITIVSAGFCFIIASQKWWMKR